MMQKYACCLYLDTLIIHDTIYSEMLIICINLFQVLEHASVCLTRIAESFASSPEKLDQLCNYGLVAQAASLIAVSNSAGQASLSTLTYTVCFYFTYLLYYLVFMQLC